MIADPLSALSSLAAALRRIWRERRANVMMFTAFALIPLTFATGMGVDYSRAMSLQSKVASVADAASLAAVTQPMMQKPILTACDVARRTFVAQATGLAGLHLDPLIASQFTITITDTYASLPPATLTCPTIGLTGLDVGPIPLSRVARIDFRGTSDNSFAGVLGLATLTIKGSATAKTVNAPFIDIHLALDTSQSMGLAATDADALKLWNATLARNGRGCQFGCHARDPNEKYSMEDIARMPDVNAKLRVDVLRDATTDMIDTAVQSQGTNTSYQFALYRIGKNAGRYAIGVDQYAPLTTDLASVRRQVQSLSLSANDGSVGFGDTDLPGTTNFVLPYIKATSAAYDDGTTQVRARKFFFIVTDGVTDTEGWCTYGHCTSPMNPATCDAYKQKGITVGVVYTTYLPTKADPTNPRNPALRDEYIKLIQPIATQIAPALQACASPGYFFEASDGPGIHAAMQKLFAQATKTPTLTR
ncbi:TadE/TadG family type IV pilus assembly protein [Sphingomonas sp. CLY1604]|uniref:TadE/TadG family type IV pilus assembly protein n=1 Tax=Sphingomonas sp. CLY1604 TaxID=3457786 RepID=UPI003FD80CED